MPIEIKKEITASGERFSIRYESEGYVVVRSADESVLTVTNLEGIQELYEILREIFTALDL